MFGCDKFCTYCIVPFTRGREKSRTKEAIFTEIANLEGKGVANIVLLGQNVNSYGISEGHGYLFANLLEDIVQQFKWIKNIRFYYQPS